MNRKILEEAQLFADFELNGRGNSEEAQDAYWKFVREEYHKKAKTCLIRLYCTGCIMLATSGVHYYGALHDFHWIAWSVPMVYALGFYNMLFDICGKIKNHKRMPVKLFLEEYYESKV